jgi:hypothetical protein
VTVFDCTPPIEITTGTALPLEDPAGANAFTWYKPTLPGASPENCPVLFQISSLAPGEYRFVALRHREDDRDRASGELENALAAAAKVDVTAGTVENIGLVPVDVK